MVLSLPLHPDIAHLKRQAKQLVRAHRRGLSAPCAVLRSLRRFSGQDDRRILSSPLALHDAQYALAMEYGFPSWNALRTHVESIRKAEPAVGAPSLVHPDSLAASVDAASDTVFFRRRLSDPQKREIAAFIAARQGLPGSYGKLFAPTRKDATEGFRLYTGERILPGPGAWHILGEEAFRALLVLDSGTADVRAAMAAAWEPFPEWLRKSLRRPARRAGSLQPGMFCCMKCSCALWRHLAARSEGQHEGFLTAGVKALRMSRDGEGGWKHWPFHYTLLTLSEIGIPVAREEIRYAAQACERERSKRLPKADTYPQRRRAVLERVLALI
jgi:hypothetical protein